MKTYYYITVQPIKNHREYYLKYNCEDPIYDDIPAGVFRVSAVNFSIFRTRLHARIMLKRFTDIFTSSYHSTTIRKGAIFP